MGSGVEVGFWAQCLLASTHRELGTGERVVGRDTGYLKGPLPVLGGVVRLWVKFKQIS